MSIDKSCDRCGGRIELGSPMATIHYKAPLESPETYRICQGCAAEFETFWNMESGDFAKERLNQARQKSRGDYT